MTKNEDDPDAALWAAYARQVEKLEHDQADIIRQPKARPGSSAKNKSPETPPASKEKTESRHIQQKDNESLPQLDRRTEQRLRQGKMPIDYTLDLHGMTQDQAHRALKAAIEQSYAAGHRTLLVITGKGAPRGLPFDFDAAPGSSKGVLKQKVPVWLGSPPLKSMILRFVTARPDHGGEGALYVYLRKQK